jgi:hypothetical protein
MFKFSCSATDFQNKVKAITETISGRVALFRFTCDPKFSQKLLFNEILRITYSEFDYYSFYVTGLIAKYPIYTFHIGFSDATDIALLYLMFDNTEFYPVKNRKNTPTSMG